ncbi:hypothetical protein Tcan_08604 [Toxocara canis]|uniref:Uncharacterized protein n=1 Tax=Toxocara canis TaxID=6265 RepID=A0A0B2UZ96_TOXCA|nr:hypothetical protein Tcan_08604 [Toxocara canis]
MSTHWSRGDELPSSSVKSPREGWSAGSPLRDIRVHVPLRNEAVEEVASRHAITTTPVDFNEARVVATVSTIRNDDLQSEQNRCQGQVELRCVPNRGCIGESIPESGSFSHLEVNAESLHRLHGDLSSAATIALTTSAYADDMRPREEDIGQIPQGVVSQNRRLFGGNSSIQSTTPLGSSASSPCTVPRSAFELLLESKRRASREADDELKNKVQRTSSVARETLFGSSSGLPHAIPSSCVLLRHSQEVLSKRRRDEQQNRFDEVPVTRTSSFNIGRTDAPRRESLETEMCDREKVETKRDGRTVVRMDGREYEKQKIPPETTSRSIQLLNQSISSAIITNRDVMVKRATNYEVSTVENNTTGTIEKWEYSPRIHQMCAVAVSLIATGGFTNREQKAKKTRSCFF